jgi:hypothetical protein
LFRKPLLKNIKQLAGNKAEIDIMISEFRSSIYFGNNDKPDQTNFATAIVDLKNFNTSKLKIIVKDLSNDMLKKSKRLLDILNNMKLSLKLISDAGKDQRASIKEKCTKLNIPFQELVDFHDMVPKHEEIISKTEMHLSYIKDASKNDKSLVSEDPEEPEDPDSLLTSEAGSPLYFDIQLLKGVINSNDKDIINKLISLLDEYIRIENEIMAPVANLSSEITKVITLLECTRSILTTTKEIEEKIEKNVECEGEGQGKSEDEGKGEDEGECPEGEDPKKGGTLPTSGKLVRFVKKLININKLINIKRIIKNAVELASKETQIAINIIPEQASSVDRLKQEQSNNIKLLTTHILEQYKSYEFECPVPPSQTRPAKGHAIGPATRSATRSETGPETGPATRTATRSATRPETGPATRSATGKRQAVEPVELATNYKEGRPKYSRQSSPPGHAVTRSASPPRAAPHRTTLKRSPSNPSQQDDPKKPKQDGGGKNDKYKLRIEQYKNKEFSKYFENKIKTYINDKNVNIYKIGVKKLKIILKDLYKIYK